MSHTPTLGGIPIVVQGPDPQPLTADTGIALKSLPPLSLYVHVPWCVRKCPYCDFNSHEVPVGGLDETAYLEALMQDLDQALPLVWGRKVISVFVGGGTPSLLSAQAVDALMTGLRARLPLLPDAEITLEANPGTFEQGRYEGYAQAGINRLSVGVQSFQPRHLRILGRVHDAHEARAALAQARRIFDRVNADLMFALPGQTPEEALDDLQQALDAGVDHLSLYHLTLEPNTVFAKYPPQDLPDEDAAWALQDCLHDHLRAAGLQRYEVSAWSKSPAHRSRHNLNYWQFGDYLGIGPGAHSKLSYHDRIVRQARLKSPASWMAAVGQGAHLAEDRVVSPIDLPFEFMMNALRLVGGVPRALWTQTTSLPEAVLLPVWRQALDKGWVETDSSRWAATPQGLEFLNEVLALFLKDAQ
jgi:oxygen-independent coproporphyrinogen-3 oxidase